MWNATSHTEWADTLATYNAVIAAQDVRGLVEHDHWYHEQLPALIRSGDTPALPHEALVRLTEWKMARGVWRARNLHLVKGNTAEEVDVASQAAFAAVPHATRPISALAALAGVGPATASAALAAFAPSVYPFFDELVAMQVPDLGPVKFTLGYYARYARALVHRAAQLGSHWTPAMVERALYAHVGGKAGAHTHSKDNADG